MCRGYGVFDQKAAYTTWDQPESVELTEAVLDFETGHAEDGDERGTAAGGGRGRRGGDGGGGGAEEGR